MGFGHGVYKIQDPRSPVVKSWVEKLISDDDAKLRFEIAKKIDEIMDKEKNYFQMLIFMVVFCFRVRFRCKFIHSYFCCR